ncbi:MULTISPECIES: hypothetical protein [Metabacillus]|uniref:Uncharacterized protein n=1 Tax=Metabacillus hrfriensis TaxID=3048891 RepID=A0ACD4RCV7_9BACI|nr:MULTISPECIES: hypothetical protein [Metabacillus]UAL52754.1 hypothetical protein K8L98_02630 [Metabacillus dongyingensis]USK29076.1 hypothetical protein LIT32_02675 [Bacillus sp. CMF21]WHZ58294.1 hypothetical protein QLQ22_02655 [Metabacillus sp. CT-WN-B3]
MLKDFNYLEWISAFQGFFLLSLKVLLKGTSYEDKILPQLIEHYGESIKENFNSVIRLYDFEYNEVEDEVKSANNNILFMSAVTY